jgi:hypothetical protein
MMNVKKEEGISSTPGKKPRNTARGNIHGHRNPGCRKMKATLYVL